MTQPPQTEKRPLAKSLREYGRGITGGLLFSLPLLFTEEVWIAGILASPAKLLLYAGATFVLLLGINRFAGLRSDSSFFDVVIDSIEELGLGLLIAAAGLWLLDRIGADEPINEIIGQITVAALTIATGIAVGTAQFNDDGDSGGDADDEPENHEKENQSEDQPDKNQSEEKQSEQKQPKEKQPEKESAEQKPAANSTNEESADETGAAKQPGGGLLRQIVLAWCGAWLFASSIAPTEEIAHIAAAASLWKLLALVLVSLGLGALIIYYSGFASAKVAKASGGFSVLSGTFVAYAVALSTAAISLWFYGRFDDASLIAAIAHVIVLGVAAMLGAAAGRILLQV